MWMQEQESRRGRESAAVGLGVTDDPHRTHPTPPFPPDRQSCAARTSPQDFTSTKERIRPNKSNNMVEICRDKDVGK